MAIKVGETYKDGNGRSVTIMGEYSASPHRRFVGIVTHGPLDFRPAVFSEQGKRMAYADGSGGVSAFETLHLQVENVRYIRAGSQGVSPTLFLEEPVAEASQVVLKLIYNSEGIIQRVELAKANTRASAA